MKDDLRKLFPLYNKMPRRNPLQKVQCEICGASVIENSLKRHHRSKKCIGFANGITPPNTEPCPDCGKRITTSNMKRHQRDSCRGVHAGRPVAATTNVVNNDNRVINNNNNITNNITNITINLNNSKITPETIRDVLREHFTPLLGDCAGMKDRRKRGHMVAAVIVKGHPNAIGTTDVARKNIEYLTEEGWVTDKGGEDLAQEVCRALIPVTSEAYITEMDERVSQEKSWVKYLDDEVTGITEINKDAKQGSRGLENRFTQAMTTSFAKKSPSVCYVK